MSASREKKVRQERGTEGLNTRQQQALKEQREARRSTVLFTLCAVLIVVGVAASLLWNSGVFTRGAAAARVNGKTYTVSDMAYYYYNGRANLLSSNSSLDSGASLRDQEYTDSDEYDTWYDYLANEAVRSLANVELTAQAARDAGFDGGSAVDDAVKETMDSLNSTAAGYGYSVSGYIKAIFNSLVTRSGFESSLRSIELADAYTASKADVANYSAAELDAAYDADPKLYEAVDYEYAVFLDSDFMPETAEETDVAGDAAEAEADTEADAEAAAEAARAAAQDALDAYREGKSLEYLAEELGGSYSAGYAYYFADTGLNDWLYDDARKDGDVTVLDYSAYYGMITGSQVVVFRSKARADDPTVNVRHILVEDEATANDVLAQFNAGDQTEESFAALAQEHSTDNADDGGLYENVYVGQMVPEFNDWCFDASRQTGDTGIVQTSYGYHIMYFVSRSDTAYWQQLAASKLASDWQAGLTESIATELLDGMKYIDP